MLQHAFVAASLVAVAGPAAVPQQAPQVPQSPTSTPPAASAPQLTHGPFRGHVDATSLHVWARAAVAGEHRLELLPLAGGAPFVAEAVAQEADDLTLRFAATGLPAGMAFGVRIRRGDVVVHEDLAAGWTAALPDDARAATVAFGSCASDKGMREQPIWGRILAARPHALALLGDTPYIDNGSVDARRRRHQDFFDVPAIAATLRQIPTWTTWDDHDYALNDQFGDVKAAATAREVFVAYHAHASYGDGTRGVWTSFRQGPIEVFLLDPRSFADTGPSPLAPTARTALGGAQVEWLQRGLRASTAAVKVLACGMVWNAGVRPGKKDCWGNWPEERDALFRWLGQERIDGVVLVSGDVHRSRVIVHPTRALAGYDLPEFVTSPLANTVIEENAVPVTGLRFDAGEPHSCLVLSVAAAPDDVDGGRLRAAFLAGDGREFHVHELALARLAEQDAAPTYRQIATSLRARLGAELELPELDLGAPGEDQGAPGAAWQPLLADFAADLGAWHAVAGLRRCRLAPAADATADSELVGELAAPMAAALQLAAALAAQSIAARDVATVERVLACQLAWAVHLRDQRDPLAWALATEAERQAADLLRRAAVLGATAAPLTARVQAHLQARPTARAMVEVAVAACDRQGQLAIRQLGLGGDAQGAVARQHGARVRQAFRAELATLAERARALGEPATAAQYAAVDAIADEWRERLKDRASALRLLNQAGPGDADLVGDVGFLLVTLLAPPLATLHREHVEAGEGLAAAVK